MPECFKRIKSQLNAVNWQNLYSVYSTVAGYFGGQLHVILPKKFKKPLAKETEQPYILNNK